mmetsp:Transcript_1854/g.4116  ORF Transcript_1854/g.4116 Transcript_1854/m.4116 type:complete len:351 (-) Transcript_1854:53-1105(-)
MANHARRQCVWQALWPLTDVMAKSSFLNKFTVGVEHVNFVDSGEFAVLNFSLLVLLNLCRRPQNTNHRGQIVRTALFQSQSDDSGDDHSNILLRVHSVEDKLGHLLIAHDVEYAITSEKDGVPFAGRPLVALGDNAAFLILGLPFGVRLVGEIPQRPRQSQRSVQARRTQRHPLHEPPGVNDAPLLLGIVRLVVLRGQDSRSVRPLLDEENPRVPEVGHEDVVGAVGRLLDQAGDCGGPPAVLAGHICSDLLVCLQERGHPINAPGKLGSAMLGQHINRHFGHSVRPVSIEHGQQGAVTPVHGHSHRGDVSILVVNADSLGLRCSETAVLATATINDDRVNGHRQTLSHG